MLNEGGDYSFTSRRLERMAELLMRADIDEGDWGIERNILTAKADDLS
jgi:hypothetical protein